MANSISGVGGSSSAAQVDILQTSRASKQGVQGATQSVSDPASSAQTGDATVLSNLGNLIANAAKLAGTQGAIRPEVVASFKAQLSAGTYHPDPDAVATSVAAALKT